MSEIAKLAANQLFYIPLLVFLIGQIVKYLVHAGRGEVQLRYLFSSGGMPSVHTATVASLAMVSLLTLGAANPLTGALLIVAGIVVYDALGVRRSAGEQAQILNRLIDDLGRNGTLAGKYRKIKAALGHKPTETIAGAILGIGLAWVLVTYPGLGKIFSIEGLFAEPTKLASNATVLRSFVVFFGGLLIWSVAMKIYYSTRTIEPSRKKMMNRLLLFTASGGLYGLLYGFLAFQQIKIVSFPIWLIAGLIAWLAWGIWVSSYYHKRYKGALEEDRDRVRKEKWLS